MKTIFTIVFATTAGLVLCQEAKEGQAHCPL